MSQFVSISTIMGEFDSCDHIDELRPYGKFFVDTYISSRKRHLKSLVDK